MLDYPAYLEAARRNFYRQDPAFRQAMTAQLPEDWQDWAEERFDTVGELASTTWSAWAETANANPPRLLSHNRWGERIDEVEVHPAYDRLAQEAYEAGVVWPRFTPRLDGKKSPWAVVFGLGYLMSQAEQGFFCPVCLTAGTAWVVERFADDDLKQRYLPRLAAKSYENMLEGAMFLTERAGGSDVGANQLTARQEDGEWRLYGDKWFCSNGGRAGVMLVLARPEGAPAGTRGLGLFLVPRELPDGSRNPMRLERLKDKLGTRSMPSAEITFEGTVGYPVGPIDRGFAEMAEMLTLSRIYNAVASVGVMKRMVNEARAWTRARSTFGQPLDRYPMMRQQLVDQTVEHEASLLTVFESIRLLDRVEAGKAEARDAQVLRVLTPINKYATARLAVDMASWGCEVFGGVGYIEEWPTPRFFRDAQVLPIWEGTTNILVLDVLRSFAKEQTGPAFLAELGARLSAVSTPALAPWREAISRQVADLEQHLMALTGLPEAEITLHAKTWCDRAFRLFQAVLLLERASAELEQDQGRATLVFAAFMRKHLPTGGGWREAIAHKPVEREFEAIVDLAPVSAAEAIALVRQSQAATTF